MMRNKLLLLWLLLFAVPAAFAQREVTYDQINEVAKEMYCPVCESEPLDTCATQACQDWREEIGDQLAAGMTKDEIHENFRARYGDRVLANPPAEGLNLILWFGIPVLLLVGGLFFYRYLRQLSTAEPVRQSDMAAPPPPSDRADLDRYRQKIEEELRQR